MKKATISHIKFEMLGSLLELSRWETVGVLETLWQFCQNHAYDGDLSKFDPKLIAVWFGWKREPQLLIDKLVESGWIDRNEDVLAVHDWNDHAPNWVKGALKTTLAKKTHDSRQGSLSGMHSDPHSSTLEGRVRKGKAKKGETRPTVEVAPEGVGTEAWQSWLATRKDKRLCKPTQSVLNRIQSEAAKLGWTLADAIQIAAERGWGGFEASWINPIPTCQKTDSETPLSHHPVTKFGNYSRNPKQKRVTA